MELGKTPDILEESRGGFVKVGFAAETQDLLENAMAKVLSKSLDLIVANDVTADGSGFGTDANKAMLLDREGKAEDLPLMSKYELGNRILDRVRAFLKNPARP